MNRICDQNQRRRRYFSVFLYAGTAPGPLGKPAIVLDRFNTTAILMSRQGFRVGRGDWVKVLFAEEDGSEKPREQVESGVCLAIRVQSKKEVRKSIVALRNGGECQQG
jgi:hypothetical protein